MSGSVPVWMMILGFLLILGPLVTVHELGHYLVGRWFGVKADAFSVGFGKEIAGYTDKLGTRWKLSLLPLGGYVQFAGDMNPASQPSEEWLSLPEEERNKTFQSKSLWKRALIVFAGPATNFIVAVLIFAMFAMSYGKSVTPPVIEAFLEGSPAQAAGMKVGDKIVAIDDNQIEEFEQVSPLIAPYPNQTVTITYERAGETLSLPVTIGSLEITDNIGKTASLGRLGVGSNSRKSVRLGPIDAVGYGFDESFGLIGAITTGIKQIFVGDRSVRELGGPISIANYSGKTLSLGPQVFVHFMAFVSINLAFINLLPIPVLDGGHLAFYAAEAVRRKPASPKFQEWTFRIGLSLVLALMVFVTINDLVSLPVFSS